MIEKLLLTISIIFTTIGLNSSAINIDQKVINNDNSDSNTAFAFNESLPLPEILPRVKVKKNAPAANILAQSYILIHDESGIILTQNDSKVKRPIASTTKIMTAVVALENYNLDDTATVSKEAVNQIGSTANLRIGEKITIKSLLHTLLISSCNSSAYALAEHINKNEEKGISKFVNLMNQKAEELGMRDTEYHDPAGLDTTGYSTAYDLSLVTRYALKKDLFRQIVGTDAITVYNTAGTISHSVTNSNRLVGEWKYPGAIGVKTGYMPEAGHCLVAAAKRDNSTLISVVLQTIETGPTKSALESKKLLDWGFDNIELN